ncbi:hypothetical protein L2E82_34677 [Cichorium intybus]|uniref:Uncharacterized protein n=1 Tax=Cichorium intybus TaxID=13427 RepID=A0ACB9BMH3_CICIN|nr:hypothetical protein L2E82_34677 [Cichorium intybus]
MVEIIGKISSSSFKFSINDYSCDKYQKLSPVMVKMPTVSNSRSSFTLRSPAGGETFGQRAVVGGQQRGIGIGKPLKWWETGHKPNMKEVTGADDLVNSLLTAGDNLVIVGFFSPGCGGCKALHPKICQLAGMNPDVQFLQVNYEEHKSMCYSLSVHVLPFFRFYRGADGRVCSFSCTNATIKKFKDALAKHTKSRCSLGPPKGLEEKELLALGSNRDLSFTYGQKPNQPQTIAPVSVPKSGSNPPLPLPRPLKSVSKAEDDKDRTLISWG